MKKRLFVLLAVIVVLSVASIPTLAGPPVDAEGVWCYIPDLATWVVEKEAGGNQFITVTEYAVWTGTFDGESVDHCRAAFHPSGAMTAFCEISFASVTVGDKTGALDEYKILKNIDKETADKLFNKIYY